jgi:hypothetical protein
MMLVVGLGTHFILWGVKTRLVIGYLQKQRT